MSKLLSICVPTYNRSETLALTLASLLPQVQEDESLEVLVSDNASSDITPRVVSELSERYPTLRYHRNASNLGFDGNIVECLTRAEGEYVWFVSDDDIVLDGVVRRIVGTLLEQRPTLLYINHYAFSGARHLPAVGFKHPAADRVFSGGKDFLLFAGLGFISALTVKRDTALRHLTAVKLGKGQAHLDIAARVALLSGGPFVFLGTCSVAARAAATAVDYSVTYACLNEARFYLGLAADGLLDQATAQRRVGGTISHNLLRAVLAKKCRGNATDLRRERADLIEVYGRHPSFYLVVFPVLILPSWLLRPPYRLALTALRLIRKVRLGR